VKRVRLLMWPEKLAVVKTLGLGCLRAVEPVFFRNHSPDLAPSQAAHIAILEEQLRLASAERFAPKSEKFASLDQLNLFNEAEVTAQDDDAAEPAGIKRMKRFKALAASDPVAGVNYGDGLMMSMEAIKALRLCNLSGMLVDHNIALNQLDEYELQYEPHVTKTRARIRAPLPDELAPWIKRWLEVVRPSLLRVKGREGRAMWITSKGTDMAEITLYYRFCKATKQETGKRINPHLCRKIIVTGIAIGAPEMIELAPEALDHTSRRHTKDAYDLADDLAASRVVNQIVGRRRLEAIRRFEPVTKRIAI
jgi:integrase